jgi:microcystin-dependent protein
MSLTDGHTPNLNLTQPADGASDDTWGLKTNSNWSILDALFGVGGANTVVKTNAAGNAAVQGIDISTPTPLARFINWFTGTSQRWQMGANATAESGANFGSDLVLSRYDDLGNVIDVPVTITRSTGVVKFAQTPTVGANKIINAGDLSAVGAFYEPVGTIKMYVGTVDPPAVATPVGDGIQHYMLCDGRSLVGTAFPALFAIIGTQYGGSAGNFNLPNTAERVIVGKSTTQTLIPQYDARAMGNSFGEGRHIQLGTELAAHAHTITDPGHAHDVHYTNSNNNPATGAGAIVTSIAPAGGNVTTQTASKTIGIAATDSFGAAAPMNVVQPSLVAQFIIRVI